MAETENTQTSNELLAVLDGLRSEGTMNSSGVFTIDLAKALPKLEKFQLPKPHFGLLKVIQSAIVSGASKIETHFTTSTIRINHNGTAPNSHELRHILSYLMAPDHPTHERSLRDLAIGINTTLARGSSWVEVRVKDEDAWVGQRWLSREESEQTQKVRPLDGDFTTSFEMRRTIAQAASRAFKTANTDIGALMRGSRDALDEDSRAVFDRCRHAPADIQLNERSLPPSMFGRTVSKRWSILSTKQHRRANLMDIYLVCDEPSAHNLSPPTRSEATLKYVVEGEFTGTGWHKKAKPYRLTQDSDFSRRCFAVIGVRTRNVSPGVVTLVKDGVDLTTMAPPILNRGVATVMSAEGLALDLSHFRIIQGPAIEERLSWLSSMIKECLSEILESIHLDDLDPEEQSHIERLAGSTHSHSGPQLP